MQRRAAAAWMSKFDICVLLLLFASAVLSIVQAHLGEPAPALRCTLRTLVNQPVRVRS